MSGSAVPVNEPEPAPEPEGSAGDALTSGIRAHGHCAPQAAHGYRMARSRISTGWAASTASPRAASIRRI